MVVTIVMLMAHGYVSWLKFHGLYSDCGSWLWFMGNLGAKPGERKKAVPRVAPACPRDYRSRTYERSRQETRKNNANKRQINCGLREGQRGNKYGCDLVPQQ